MTMRDRLKEGTVANKLSILEMRIQFAKVCLYETDPVRNEEVYNALSHLALISELKINLCEHESLRVPPENSRLNVDKYLLARNKLAEAMVLRDTILEENYAISRRNCVIQP